MIYDDTCHDNDDDDDNNNDDDTTKMQQQHYAPCTHDQLIELWHNGEIRDPLGFGLGLRRIVWRGLDRLLALLGQSGGPETDQSILGACHEGAVRSVTDSENRLAVGRVLGLGRKMEGYL